MVSNFCPVRLAYQTPANNTFLSEQTSHQPPASSTFRTNQHQPSATSKMNRLFAYHPPTPYDSRAHSSSLTRGSVPNSSSAQGRRCNGFPQWRRTPAPSSATSPPSRTCSTRYRLHEPPLFRTLVRSRCCYSVQNELIEGRLVAAPPNRRPLVESPRLRSSRHLIRLVSISTRRGLQRSGLVVNAGPVIELVFHKGRGYTFASVQLS
jgi:hypothetical protein